MDILSGLAAKLGQPKAQIIELALRELEERTFRDDVQRAFALTASDPVESAGQRHEFALWDRLQERAMVIERGRSIGVLSTRCKAMNRD